MVNRFLLALFIVLIIIALGWHTTFVIVTWIAFALAYAALFLFIYGITGGRFGGK